MRPPKMHDLKVDVAPYEAQLDGKKTCEFRKSDRDFVEGDYLLLRRSPGTVMGGEDCFHAILLKVTHIDRGPEYGIPEGYCVMSTRRIER